MGVMPYFGAKIDRWERAVGLDPDVMIKVSVKWSDEGDWVSLKIRDAREETEKVTLNKFFCRYPKLFSAVINDLVLVRVAVNGKGIGRSVEKVRKKISYRYL